MYDAGLGSLQGISNALVSVLTCLDERLQTRAGADGDYELLLPGAALSSCLQVTLEVTAPGYEPYLQQVAVALLRADPQRDFPLLSALTPTPTGPAATATASASATRTPTPSATATRTATASATATRTATPAATATRTPPGGPTPTATAAGDLLLTGHVYDASIGLAQGAIARALVIVVLCDSTTFDTATGADGYYQLTLPALSLRQCLSVTLYASASGYHSLSEVVAVADLRAVPRRDFPLLSKLAPTPTATPTATPTRTRTPAPTPTPTATLPRRSIWLPRVLKARR